MTNVLKFKNEVKPGHLPGKKLFFLSFLLSAFSLSNAQFNASINSSTGNILCDSCFAFSANVSGGTPPYTYQWTFSGDPNNYTGQSVNYCYNHSPGGNDTLYLLVTDAYSQNAYGFLTMNFLFPITSESQPICIVGVDSTSGKNAVVWEQTTDTSVASYTIYKETTNAGVYAVAGTVSRNSFSSFTDTTSHPQQIAARYKLSMINTCGFESMLSVPAKTIHLTVSAGMPPTWNLMWDNYEGFSITKYRIWRGFSNNTMILIDSIQSSLNSYTDLNPPSGTLYYSIEAVSNTLCNPSFKVSNSTLAAYSSSFSNFATNAVLGMNNNNSPENICVYPNPFTVSAIIQLRSTAMKKDIQFELFDVLGNKIRSEKVATPKFVIEREDLLPGIYLYRLLSENKIIASGTLMAE